MSHIQSLVMQLMEERWDGRFGPTSEEAAPYSVYAGKVQVGVANGPRQGDATSDLQHRPCTAHCLFADVQLMHTRPCFAPGTLLLNLTQISPMFPLRSFFFLSEDLLQSLTAPIFPCLSWLCTVQAFWRMSLDLCLFDVFSWWVEVMHFSKNTTEMTITVCLIRRYMMSMLTLRLR